ncbi:MAG: winged helix-turn-helix domain-containing protein [Acidobacteria bacterium]|nr:winged helix-turn-helix domain-containing protein [Acidobacteriota bacterium]
MTNSESRQASPLFFGTFEFDVRSGELKREGQPVKLSPQPARVLALLVSRAGDVVLREEIKAHLWGEDTFVDFERGLNFCILQVRTALGDASDNPRFVQTVPRKGYRFIAPVASRPAPQSPPAAVDRPAVTSSAGAPSLVPSRFSWRRRRLPWTVGVLIALLPLLGWLWLARAPAATAADPGNRIRMAVLPFLNLTGDIDDEYLADGLTDELIAQLGGVSPNRLGIISRTSVMTYRGTQKTVAEIGRELHVAYVLEGSVRRDGGRLRVTAELVSTADQTQRWSDSFERSAADVMTLQTEVAARVARALALELVPGDYARPIPSPTGSAEAWDEYLRGRYWMHRGTADDVDKAVEQLQSALRRDPAFAAAWAQLAEARHLQVMIGARAPLSAYPDAADAAARAITLDSALAEAHVASGLVQFWFDWSPARAAQSFARALSIDASNGAAHHDYAWSLVALGRFDEAVQHITTARDLDPLSARANTDVGWLHLHLRQPTDATRACQHTLAIYPQSLEAQACLERAFLQRGLLAEAVAAARATLPAGTDPTAVFQPAIGPAAQLHAMWAWRLNRLQQAASKRWVSPYQMAVHHLWLDQPDQALARLQDALDQRIGMMALLASDPAMDPLRGDPRFQALVDHVEAGRR